MSNIIAAIIVSVGVIVASVLYWALRIGVIALALYILYRVGIYLFGV